MAEDVTHDKELLEASCRVALAGLLHDLGKFAERARLEVAHDRLNGDINNSCPYNKQSNYHSHKHAAYTGAAFDAIENCFPDVKKNVIPFKSGNDDSLINAAARHHVPGTFLQWIIATADRVASGFERQKFEEYNAVPDEEKHKCSHYTARLATLFEQVSVSGQSDERIFHNVSDLKFRYPLAAMSPLALFPKDLKEVECSDKCKAQDEYAKLWEAFVEGLEKIPKTHSQSFSLWLDHFDSLWACFTSLIPSATVSHILPDIIPDVSLYDHSKAVAALAVALWRYHYDRKDDEEAVKANLSRSDRPDWNDKKFLLIQGDSFGIQNFIFATGGKTQKKAAKLLRGRSFYVSLLTECAVLRILERLNLPSTSQIVNAAGKFLIVAPNTEKTIDALKELRKEFDEWFLKHTWGQTGIGIAWTPASCNDLLADPSKDTENKGVGFKELQENLFKELEIVKLRRFGLCGANAPEAIFSDYLKNFNNELGVCEIDGISPAKKDSDDIKLSEMALDQIDIGKYLTSCTRILISRESINNRSLCIPIFGFYVSFTGDADETGWFGNEVRSRSLRRCWDYTLPKDGNSPLWNGFARRYVNGYVPSFDEAEERESSKYNTISNEEPEYECGDLKTLNHIACENRLPKNPEDKEKKEKTDYCGISALMTLKGDVDNLGSIFKDGLGKNVTFARMATLSRQINSFFAVYLPYLCKTEPEYKNTYTVFAGGDDFFLIGPWSSQMKLAKCMNEKFAQYVAFNSGITFSAGLSMTKPGLPIRTLAKMAEGDLEKAKGYSKLVDGSKTKYKNAVNCFGYTVSWNEYRYLLTKQEELSEVAKKLELSTGYLYDLLTFCDMSENLKQKESNPENARWLSMFAYKTCRMLEQNKGLKEDDRKSYQTELAKVVSYNIKEFGGVYKVALFAHLYQQRD